MKIKTTNAAGRFYPADKNELFDVIDEFYSKTNKNSHYCSQAVIVPHAGYIFSGELAAKGFQYLNPNTKTVFIFAPSHYKKLFGCVSCDYDEFETPIGNCKVKKEYTKEFETDNSAFDNEHSVEVQLPFIKYFFKNADIVPVLYGCEDYKNISKIIEKYRYDETVSFVISSDLSHFYPEKECVKIDYYTAELIESGNIKNFDADLACGAVGICALADFAVQNGFSLIRNGLTNSARANGDTSRVVGYGSWFLYEGSKNEYIKEYFSEFVTEICKKSILSGFQLGQFDIENVPAVFEQKGASFVTLELDGKLRGCIGSIVPHRNLINDLAENAHSAAFKDPRFNPLDIKDFENIKIKVSLLSKPERIEFSGEEDLLAKITPYKDGIIIRDGNNQAVYLPEVWEQLPDKKLFLSELKIKAGLKKNHFSDTLQAFKFHTLVI